ncbi:hypothetical protein VCEM1676A_003592 [Vibrio cholerae O1 str. EM-1676A]|nr:hypothetical protein VCEM1676A_003592 [Vibrio cholerae O1 str. EM-1676A]
MIKYSDWAKSFPALLIHYSITLSPATLTYPPPLAQAC